MTIIATGPRLGPLLSSRRLTLPADLLRHARWRLVTTWLGLAVGAALAGDVVVALAVRQRPDVLTVCLLAQLPVLAAVAVRCCAPGRQHRSALGALVELESRALRAEDALSREHDRVHELRAVLAGIAAAHQVLSDPRAHLAPDRRRHLEHLQDAELERLERLLGDRRQRTAVVDLGAVLRPLVDAAALRGVPVAWTGTRCRVRGRPDAVAEAVHVLLVNAQSHAGGQGVALEVAEHGDEVEIRVSDRGPGVAPEVLPRIFERGARHPDSPGDGLGLAIARGLAEEMGGSLRLILHLHGEPGTTFALTLPTHEGERACLAVRS